MKMTPKYCRIYTGLLNSLLLEADNWNSLNIEPQTFYGLIEIRETVTE